jgi:hypothetical protein
MAKKTRRSAQLAGLFLLGCLLFNYPLIVLVNVRTMVAGVPLLYAYLFAAWALLILCAALVMRRQE